MKAVKLFVGLVAISSIVIIILIVRTSVINIPRKMARRVVKEVVLNVANISGNNKLHGKPVKSKLVLVYTKYFDEQPWPLPGMESPSNFLTKINGLPCDLKCHLTYNKSELPNSDGVIFHNRDLPSRRHLKKMSLSRPQRQRWMIYGLENPKNVPENVKYLNGIFNWTITYSRNADIFSSYGAYRNLTANELKVPKKSTNYAKEKDRLVALAISNCGKPRDKLVSKLTHLLPVAIFGRCTRHFPKRKNGLERCPRDTPECSKILRKFKFYLSFENALCEDYITEKYWETPFIHDMVPIVYGSNYDATNSIPGSYINVFDFPTVEALAKYIRYLDKNDTAYNEYFDWKKKYERTCYEWGCKLCEDLHNERLPAKVHMDLKTIWDEKRSCSQREYELVSNLIYGKDRRDFLDDMEDD